MGYDNAGTPLNHNVVQYLYDAEGRVCAVQNLKVQGMAIRMGYIYDADGERVAKGTITGGWPRSHPSKT